MTQYQHKILSAIIITGVTLMGFESLAVMIGLNQTSAFARAAVYLFLFHAFWIAFVFDLHLKNRTPASLSSARFRTLLRRALSDRFRHFGQMEFLKHLGNYFILPAILFWSTVVLLYLNPFADGMKQVVVLLSTLVFALVYWHMKEHVSARLEAHHALLRLLAVSKLFAVYAAFSAIIGYSWYFDLDPNLVFYYILAVSFFLIHQALFAYNYHRPWLVLFSIAVSAIIGFAGVWVYYNWNYQYFTGALILLASYNTVWGFIHHYLDKTLNAKVALEYLILGLLVASIVISTHNFGTQII